ncbi:MAG: proline reductase cluster protein PrdD [Lachnospirales bacterium]
MNDILKTLTIRALHIENVFFHNKVDINKKNLYITNCIDYSLYDDLSDVKISIVEPNKKDIEVNSILDIIPISTKVYGDMGVGLTHTLTGVYVLLTSSIKSGKQVSNFGACYGNLENIVKTNEIGTFDMEDFLIHIDITIKDERDLKKSVYNCHLICENIITEVRKILKEVEAKDFNETHIYEEKYKKNAKKVLLIKQVSGQGAMENNIVFPDEPSGVKGGMTMIDLHNMPVMISPNEYRDGAIRALT